VTSETNGEAAKQMDEQIGGEEGKEIGELKTKQETRRCDKLRIPERTMKLTG